MDEQHEIEALLEAFWTETFEGQRAIHDGVHESIKRAECCPLCRLIFPLIFEAI